MHLSQTVLALLVITQQQRQSSELFRKIRRPKILIPYFFTSIAPDASLTSVFSIIGCCQAAMERICIPVVCSWICSCSARFRSPQSSPTSTSVAGVRKSKPKSSPDATLWALILLFFEWLLVTYSYIGELCSANKVHEENVASRCPVVMELPPHPWVLFLADHYEVFIARLVGVGSGAAGVAVRRLLPNPAHPLWFFFLSCLSFSSPYHPYTLNCLIVMGISMSKIQDYDLIREIKMWLNFNHITLHKHTYFIF